MCDILDRQFPKGKCLERGRALVMLAFIEIMLQGHEFENGEPKKEKKKWHYHIEIILK